MPRDTRLAKNETPALTQSDQRPSVPPACDVYENDREVLVVADVPGVAANALDIHWDSGQLTIHARRDATVKDGTVIGREYRDCDFLRSFAVPGGIDSGKVDAELKNGVLWLHLPKSDAFRPRQIAVRAG